MNATYRITLPYHYNIAVTTNNSITCDNNYATRYREYVEDLPPLDDNHRWVITNRDGCNIELKTQLLKEEKGNGS